MVPDKAPPRAVLAAALPAWGTRWGHPTSRESCSSTPARGAAGRENPNECKGRTVPSSGDIGSGRGASFALLDLLLQAPFPVLLAPVLSACGQLPLALAGLEAGFAISQSINVNIVSEGCPDQRNSLKGLWPVVLWLGTKSLLCQVCQPTLPSICPSCLPLCRW